MAAFGGHESQNANQTPRREMGVSDLELVERVYEKVSGLQWRVLDGTGILDRDAVLSAIGTFAVEKRPITLHNPADYRCSRRCFGEPLDDNAVCPVCAPSVPVAHPEPGDRPAVGLVLTTHADPEEYARIWNLGYAEATEQCAGDVAAAVAAVRADLAAAWDEGRQAGWRESAVASVGGSRTEPNPYAAAAVRSATKETKP